MAALDDPDATAIGTPSACNRATRARISGKALVEAPASSR